MWNIIIPLVLAEPEFLLGQHISTPKGKEKHIMLRVGIEGEILQERAGAQVIPV